MFFWSYLIKEAAKKVVENKTALYMVAVFLFIMVPHSNSYKINLNSNGKLQRVVGIFANVEIIRENDKKEVILNSSDTRHRT